jgi:2-amino-4-hydroxy-6-hydroxymethyldihydropteridine diphosphokinase
MRYYLSIGSNMGNPLLNIKACFEKIEENGIKIEKKSSLYLTEPVDFTEQDWFVNSAISIITELEPLDLLSKLKEIEKILGRNGNGIEKGPRPIDIDIVLMDFHPFTFQSKSLIIPHRRMHLRKFVLLPLSEICPSFVHPIFKKKIFELLLSVDDKSTVYPMIG